MRDSQSDRERERWKPSHMFGYMITDAISLPHYSSSCVCLLWVECIKVYHIGGILKACYNIMDLILTRVRELAHIAMFGTYPFEGISSRLSYVHPSIWLSIRSNSQEPIQTTNIFTLYPFQAIWSRLSCDRQPVWMDGWRFSEWDCQNSVEYNITITFIFEKSRTPTPEL